MSLKKGDKMEIIRLKINDITPYDKNAIDYKRKSMRNKNKTQSCMFKK